MESDKKSHINFGVNAIYREYTEHTYGIIFTKYKCKLVILDYQEIITMLENKTLKKITVIPVADRWSMRWYSEEFWVNRSYSLKPFSRGCVLLFCSRKKPVKDVFRRSNLTPWFLLPTGCDESELLSQSHKVCTGAKIFSLQLIK